MILQRRRVTAAVAGRAQVASGSSACVRLGTGAAMVDDIRSFTLYGGKNVLIDG